MAPQVPLPQVCSPERSRAPKHSPATPQPSTRGSVSDVPARTMNDPRQITLQPSKHKNDRHKQQSSIKITASEQKPRPRRPIPVQQPSQKQPGKVKDAPFICEQNT